MPTLEVRDLTTADRDTAFDVRVRSFGPMDDRVWWDRLYDRSAERGRSIGVFADDTLVAWARLHGYRQLWGGRSLAMAGVAGVVIAPEWRGRGVSRLLMTQVLHRARDLGDVLSVLFPAAVPPYRQLGWEIAGAAPEYRISTNALRRLGSSDVPVRRVTRADVAEVTEVVHRIRSAGYACGALDLSTDDVDDTLDDDMFGYLAHDGVVVYGWKHPDLYVDLFAAGSVETTRALWALVGSGASAVRDVLSPQPMHDPLGLISDTNPARELDEERWMLRILDAREAIAQRGFPRGVTAEIALRLEDPLVPANEGGFALLVADGRGVLTSSEPTDAAVLSANGLAALYAGTPTTTLRSSGLLRGSMTHDPALDAVFGCRTSLVEHF